jgi:glycosyltransferase involved in cell wall biosynthesis
LAELLVRIPSYNEAEDLPAILAGIPRVIEGIAIINILVIDDGSSERTSKVARIWGTHQIVRHP